MKALCEAIRKRRRTVAKAGELGPGVELLTATATVAAIGDVRTFKSGREFAACWGSCRDSLEPVAGCGRWV